MSDMWIDAPEQLVRYLEIELKPIRRRQASGADARWPRSRIAGSMCHSIYGKHFDGGPGDQVADPGDHARGRQDLRPTTAAARSMPTQDR